MAIILGLLLAFSFDSGREPEPILIEHKQEVKKEIEIVERIVTKTVKPDGTVVEKTIEREKSTKEESKSFDKERIPPGVFTERKPQYSLSLSYLPSLDVKPSIKDVEIEAGFRVSSSNVWLTTGSNVKYNQFSVGVRYDF